MFIQIIAVTVLSLHMRYVDSFQSVPIIRHSSHPVIHHPNNQNQNQAQTSSSRSFVAFSTSTAAEAMSSSSPSYLVNPEERDQHYGGNTAQYLVDLHDQKATLNFCGGMMFQFVLSEKLRAHLQEVATATAATSTDEEQEQQKKQQPFVFDSSHP